MKKEFFFEMYFRILTLLFWTTIIYSWIFISNIRIENNTFLIFSTLAILYIILICISQIKNNFLDNIVIYYRLSTLISYIITLASFLLYPTDLTLMLFRVISIFIYFYISLRNSVTYKLEECVVGVISSILLLFLCICY